jgi:hypothetical protein
MKNKVWIASGLAVSVITSTLTATAAPIYSGIGGVSFTAPNGQPWGQWSKIVYCPTGSYVGGYSMRVEPPQGRGDDTALNAVALYCYDRAGNMVERIEPHPGFWGNWGQVANCPRGTYATQFQLKVEPFQGTGDDTGANSLKFNCGGGFDTQIEASGGGPWGNWSRWLEVGPPLGFQFGSQPRIWAICGARARVESPIGARDDTALNDLEFFWCGS